MTQGPVQGVCEVCRLIWSGRGLKNKRQRGCARLPLARVWWILILMELKLILCRKMKAINTLVAHVYI